VLLAEAVDKRKRLYKYIDKQGVIFDLTVDTGSSSAARKDQEAVLRELAGKSFAALGKKLEPRALPVLLERVGFHPVAVVMESEKLALHAGLSSTVTLADLDLLIGRTREEALFELTEAVGNRDLAAALASLARLQEGQIHALVIVAGLRNLIKKLMLARSFQDRGEPAYGRGMAFPAFQKGYLPRLKEGGGEWPQLLAGHPFVVYKMFRQAEGFSAAALRQALAQLLAAEYRLKSSRLPEPLVLQHFLLQLFLDTGIRTLGRTHELQTG
jgi:DNA polymerase-3 subunit delta